MTTLLAGEVAHVTSINPLAVSLPSSAGIGGTFYPDTLPVSRKVRGWTPSVGDEVIVQQWGTKLVITAVLTGGTKTTPVVAIPSARARLTSGFFGLSTDWRTIPLTADRTQGGCVFTRNGIQVPTTGLYSVKAMSYFTGASGLLCMAHVTQSGATGSNIVMGSFEWKPNGNDVQFSMSDDLPAVAGDIFTLQEAAAATPNGQFSAYGDQNGGCRLTVAQIA